MLLQNTLVQNTQRSPIQSDLHVSDMDSVGRGSPRHVPKINKAIEDMGTSKNNNANVEYFSAPSERKNDDETKIEEDNKILESLADGNIEQTTTLRRMRTEAESGEYEMPNQFSVSNDFNASNEHAVTHHICK